MRLRLPTMDDLGRDATLSAHFLSAPYRTLVDTESEQLEFVVNRDAYHAAGTCEAVRALGPRGVDAVFCRGVGRRAYAALRKLGIRVHVADAGSVGRALDAFRAGRFPLLREAQACHDDLTEDVPTSGRHRGGQCRAGL